MHQARGGSTGGSSCSFRPRAPLSGGSGGGGLFQRSQQQLQDQLDTARRVMADAASQFRQLLLYLVRADEIRPLLYLRPSGSYWYQLLMSMVRKP